MKGAKGERDGETTDRRGRTARGKLRRLLPAGLAATFVVTALLVLTTPLAAATTPLASFSAPYSGGKAVQFRDPVAQGCGASLTVYKAAAFNLTTGHGVGWAAAKSSTCATSDSQASYDGIVGVRGLHFTVSTTGNYSIKAHWTVTWNGTASMTAAAASAGAQSTVEIWLVVKLTDLTTLKTIVGKTVFIVQKDLLSAQTFAGGAVRGIYAAGIGSTSLTAGHSYAVYAVMGFDIQAVVPAGSPSSAHVSASVDLGSTSHGGFLTSVVVS